MKLGVKLGSVALIVAAIAAIAWKATSDSSTVTFYTPAEVYAKTSDLKGKSFRVSGLVLGGTKSWDPMQKLLSFRLTDLEGHEFRVNYVGIPPDLFKEGQGVVVEGRLKGDDLRADNTLDATLLMVKHSEVYDTTQDHKKMKEARLLDSIKLNENLGSNTSQSATTP